MCIIKQPEDLLPFIEMCMLLKLWIIDLRERMILCISMPSADGIVKYTMISVKNFKYSLSLLSCQPYLFKQFVAEQISVTPKLPLLVMDNIPSLCCYPWVSPNIDVRWIIMVSQD